MHHYAVLMKPKKCIQHHIRNVCKHIVIKNKKNTFPGGQFHHFQEKKSKDNVILFINLSLKLPIDMCIAWANVM